jgi:hypothetical protein
LWGRVEGWRGLGWIGWRGGQFAVLERIQGRRALATAIEPDDNVIAIAIARRNGCPRKREYRKVFFTWHLISCRFHVRRFIEKLIKGAGGCRRLEEGGEVASHHAYIPYRKKQKTYELKRTQKKGEERQVEIIERRREETRYERAQLQHADGP